jgi:hypothetical protein
MAGSASSYNSIALVSLAGLLRRGAALLTTVRIIPWQLQRTLSHPHLWTLALDYLWLASAEGAVTKPDLASSHHDPGYYCLNPIFEEPLGCARLVSIEGGVTDPR